MYGVWPIGPFRATLGVVPAAVPARQQRVVRARQRRRCKFYERAPPMVDQLVKRQSLAY
jgi:hypothetical protein